MAVRLRSAALGAIAGVLGAFALAGAPAQARAATYTVTNTNTGSGCRARVSGVYRGWRLLTDPPPGRAVPTVQVFEQSHRIGGRLLSVQPPGIPGVFCELGGMRYMSSQALVRSLIENVRDGQLPHRTSQCRHCRSFGRSFGVAKRHSGRSIAKPLRSLRPRPGDAGLTECR
jgi:Flavin containing amine oxidoreductase